MSSADPAELLAAWRKTYGELYPHRPMEQMPVDDATLALGLTLQRQFQEFIRNQVTSANRAASVASLRPRDLERIVRHDPKDTE